MMDKLENFVSEKLDFLERDHGFVPAHSVNTGDNSDALIEMKNKDILVQVIKDRGLTSIYFANNHSPKELFELSELIEIVKGERHDFQSTDPAAIQFLKDHFNLIENLLVTDFPEGIKKRDLLRKETLRSLGYEDEGEE